MSSVALRNDTLIEISTFLIRRWSENDKIIVTMSPKKAAEIVFGNVYAQWGNIELQKVNDIITSMYES